MNFIRKYISLLLLMLIPIIIEQKSLYTFVKWLWVDPIAQHFSGNPFFSILFIVIVSYIYYEGFFHRKSKLILPVLLVVIIILVKTYSMWEFKSYFWLIPFAILVIYIISEFKTKIKIEKYLKIDQLKREGFADSILTDIRTQTDLEHSFNYGLVGEWGSGKSFLMEMIYSKMVKEPETFIPFYFKPWEAPNEKDFTVKILNGIKINSENQDIKNRINRFLTKIETDSGDILTKTFTTILNWALSDDSSIEDIKEDLSNYLKKHDKRLIVFLDDLDRLDESEIKELLRLMRNTFDIPYLFFIVGFDRNYLAKTLRFSNEEFDNYSSKFFQVRTNIPMLNKHDLFDKYYKDKICSILLRDPNNSKEKEEFRNFIPDFFLELINTPRDFENIISTFELSHRNLKDNCDWPNLFQLEIL